MELYIAGGCGEHGRNCFYLQEGEDAFLVDCGLMTGTKEPFPRLSPEQIARLRAVFLTHSHADHSGALPWLREQGYHGVVVAAAPTLEQLPFAVGRSQTLESICRCGAAGLVQGTTVIWGRSGHCAGSVWLKLLWRGKTVLFSGDYCEQSRVYPCDTLCTQRADLAVLDCAYGHSTTPENRSSAFITAMRRLLEKTPLVFLPVPKYGRGLDLLWLLHEAMPQQPVYADGHFCRQAEKVRNGAPWYQPVPQEFSAWARPYCKETEGIVFLSDPQLCKAAGVCAQKLLAMGGRGLMTGTPDAGSFSAELLQNGQMEFLRYPVHLDAAQCQALAAQNSFGRVVPYHSPEVFCERRIEITS